MEDGEVALATIDPLSSIFHPRFRSLSAVRTLRFCDPLCPSCESCVHGMAGCPLSPAGSLKVSFF